MQTVYIGNTLINDVMLGSQRMDDVLQLNVTPIRTGLTALWEGNYNTATSSWRAYVGNYTASMDPAGANGKVTLITGSNKTPYYAFSGSLPSFVWGNASDITSTGQDLAKARTVLLWINPSSLTNQSVLSWCGQNAGGVLNGDLQFVISSAANQNKLVISGSLPNGGGVISTGSAVNLNSVVTGSWQMVGYTTNGGNTIGAFEVWLNNSKQALTGSGIWGVKVDGGNNFWEFGLVSGIKPYSGSMAYQFVYNRKLSDSEIIQNYDYIRSTFNQ